MTSAYDPSALGSDIPRTFRQLLRRRIGRAVVGVLGLNRTGPLATEIVQSIRPVLNIPTAHGPLYCQGGHGRLVWRARTFHSEEPETIAWLDEIRPDDVLWDIGANVGMYAIYAAKFRRCQVYAFEPEAQNNATLISNIALNGVGDACVAVNMPLSGKAGFGYLDVRYVTKGGAYNHFRSSDGAVSPYAPGAVETGSQNGLAARQLLYGANIDELAASATFDFPTHLKIDVDGLEPEIIDGASRVLQDPRLRSVLIEINRASERDRAVPALLEAAGFALRSERSNWEGRADRTREGENPTINMIFARPGGSPGSKSLD